MAKGKKEKKPQKQSGKPWKAALRQKKGNKPASVTVAPVAASQGFAYCETCGQNHSINALYENQGRCKRLVDISKCWRCDYVPPAGSTGKNCPNCYADGTISPSTQFCNGKLVSTFGRRGAVARARW